MEIHFYLEQDLFVIPLIYLLVGCILEFCFKKNTRLYLYIHTKLLPPLDVCGKPNPKLFEIIKKDRGVDLNKSCMVGDRLDTDIKMVIMKTI
jgi:hypothetical protein